METKIKVLPEYSDFIKSDEKYTILCGGIRTGKFYAACQKAAIDCLSKSIRFGIFCPHKQYAVDIISEILAGEQFKYNKSTTSFVLGKSSVIYILGYDDLAYITYYNKAIIKGADYLDLDIFEVFDKNTTGQIILTCNPPSHGHWLRELKKRENSILFIIHFNDTWK